MTTGEDPAGGRGVLAVAVAAGLVSHAIATIAVITPSVLAVAAAPAFGVPASAIGVYSGIIFGAALFSAMAGGTIVARYGAIRSSQICLALAVAGLAGFASGLLPLAVLGGVLIGLGYGPMTPASSHLLARLTPPRDRPLVFSIKQTSVPVGGALAGLAPPAIASQAGWQAGALAMAAVALAAVAGLQPLRARFDGDRVPGVRLSPRLAEPVREVLADPALRRIVVVSAAFAATQGVYAAFFVTFLVERAAVSLVAAGLALTAGQTVAIAARVLWGAVAERLLATRHALALIGAIMSAAALAAILVGPETPFALLLALSVTFGLSALGWNGLYLAEVARVAPGAAARATGGTLAFTFAGTMAMPTLFSFAVALGGWSLALALLALVPLPAVATMLADPRRGGSPVDDRPA